MTDALDRNPCESPFAGAEFVENPEPRCPCVLLLDTSASMQGAPIGELGAGLVAFKDELAADALAAKRVEVAVVTFGPVRVATSFVTPTDFVPPVLEASGDTPMGEAMARALDLVRERKARYRENGIPYFRPWVFLVTDGAPTDAWQEAAGAVQAAERAGKLAFFPVAVEGANVEVLGRIGTRAPVRLVGLRFREMFAWLSRSLQSVSRSRPGESVELESPTAPDGWGKV